MEERVGGKVGRHLDISFLYALWIPRLCVHVEGVVARRPNEL